MTLSYEKLDALAAELGCPFLVDEPLSRHTTFRIGGPADRLFTLETEEQLQAVLALVRQEGLPWAVLGNGSNLLAADEGCRGAVLTLGGVFRTVTLLEDGLTLRAGAGATLASVCAFAREHALTGLEFAWGIPGTVGGGVLMNAGAYGGELKDVVTAVTHVTPTGETVTLGREELDFGYRHSRYSDGRDVVTFARLRLAPGDPAAIAGRMEELMARRKEKQPYDQPSAGSAFKRPAGGYAAALIEQCGLKGARVGGAQVSPKHAGFIVNNGGATCADVRTLIRRIQEKVLAETGVALEPEIRLLGETE